jgi:hypothetical protein
VNREIDNSLSVCVHLIAASDGPSDLSPSEVAAVLQEVEDQIAALRRLGMARSLEATLVVKTLLTQWLQQGATGCD